MVFWIFFFCFWSLLHSWNLLHSITKLLCWEVNLRTHSKCGNKTKYKTEVYHFCPLLGYLLLHIESHNNLVLKLWHRTLTLLRVWKQQCHQLGDHERRRNIPNRQRISGRQASRSRSSRMRLISALLFCLCYFYLSASKRMPQECPETPRTRVRNRTNLVR